MLDVTQNATRIWKGLPSYFRSDDAGVARGSRAAAVRHPRPVPRRLCRFEYIERPAGVSRAAFATSCLLRAELKAPFVSAGRLLMQNRDGIAIWWWDAAAFAAESGQSGTRRGDVPDSIAQKLPDGWYHLQLDQGYEARRVEKGMVTASVWRRAPFTDAEWQAMAAEQGGEVPAAAPPLSVIAAPRTPIRAHGGRIVRKPMANEEKLFLLCLFVAALLGGWWQGQAASLEQAAAKADGEAARLEAFVARYPLFAEIRSDLVELNAAQKALGRTTAASDLAQVLGQVSASGLQLATFELDDSRLELGLVAGDDDDRIRTLAAQVEAMPAFVNVAAQPADGEGRTLLAAEVSK